MARDGHSCTVYNDLMIGFGGDRHHMPFNDLFVLDLASELGRQSFNLMPEKQESQAASAEAASAEPEPAAQE